MLTLLLVRAVVQGIYLNVVSPRIMAKAVKMHPLVTTASILVFGQIGGFWGAFFGIPLASTMGMLAPPIMQLVQDYLNPSADSPAMPQLATAPTGTTPTVIQSPAPAPAPAPATYPVSTANKRDPRSTLATPATPDGAD